MIKIGEKYLCIESEPMSGGGNWLTKGKVYTTVKASEGSPLVFNDIGGLWYMHNPRYIKAFGIMPNGERL